MRAVSSDKCNYRRQNSWGRLSTVCKSHTMETDKIPNIASSESGTYEFWSFKHFIWKYLEMKDRRGRK